VVRVVELGAVKLLLVQQQSDGEDRGELRVQDAQKRDVDLRDGDHDEEASRETARQLYINVNVLDVEDYRTFVLTPMQAYLVKYLYERNKSTFIVQLEFTAVASNGSNAEFVSATLTSPMPSSLLEVFYRVDKPRRVLFQLYGV